MKKNITIEDLARMVKSGFDGVDERFKKVDERFDNVDYHFNIVGKRLDQIEKKLEGVVYRREFEILETRVKELEDLLAASKKH